MVFPVLGGGWESPRLSRLREYSVPAPVFFLGGGGGGVNLGCER